MISRKCLETSWIDEQSRQLRAGDPGILEVAIHALELLCRMQRSGLDFVFKGGTSLLLHLPTIRRLSIDIDIVCEADKETFEKVLDDISGSSPFQGWTEDERGTDRMPRRRHYKVAFPSRRSATGMRHVIIDVVEEPCPIEDLEQKPVAVPFIELEEETRVTVPTVDALIATN